jgi:hypothetical protein
VTISDPNLQSASETEVNPIVYRCEDEKNLLSWGDILVSFFSGKIEGFIQSLDMALNAQKTLRTVSSINLIGSSQK